MTLEINLIVLLTLLEIIFAVIGVSVFLLFRNLSQKRQLQELEQRLAKQAAKVIAQPIPSKTPKPETQKTYEDYLRLEIDGSSVMLGDSGELERLDDEPVDENDEDAELRNILAMRHQFLQLELDAQALSRDPEAKRNHMLEGMRALITALTPDPVITEMAGMSDEDARNREQQFKDQIEALRAAVNNQHDVMRELRRLLKEHLGDSEAAKEIIAEIEKAEEEAEKLETSLSDMMTQAASGSLTISEGGVAGALAAVNDADTDMLKNLVGNQQNTINKLRNMLAEAIPDAEAAEHLKHAVDKVQRSNQELGTCVMVLEDENSRLRTEVETLQAKMQDLESAAPAPEQAQPSVETEPEPEPEPEPVAEEVDAAEPNAEISAQETEAVPEMQPEDEVSAEDDIDALLEEAAADSSDMDTQTDATIDDIDALLESAASAEPEPEAASPAVDDIDALLDEAASVTAKVETPAEEPAAAEPESKPVDDIDALLDEVAADQTDDPVSSEVSSDDEDLDALLQDVAAASQAEANDQEKPQADNAMDEVDALLAEIAQDNKKLGG